LLTLAYTFHTRDERPRRLQFVTSTTPQVGERFGVTRECVR